MLVVREYGAEVDLCSILYVLDGQPPQYGTRWTHGIDAQDFTEIKDSLELVSGTVQETKVQRFKKLSGVENTAIWIILQKMDLIKQLEQSYTFHSTKVVSLIIQTPKTSWLSMERSSKASQDNHTSSSTQKSGKRSPPVYNALRVSGYYSSTHQGVSQIPPGFKYQNMRHRGRRKRPDGERKSNP